MHASASPFASSSRSERQSKTQQQQQRIAIIGAGLAGLTLAKSLLRRGIKSIVYDRSQPSPGGPRFSIALDGAVFRRLAQELCVDAASLLEHVAAPVLPLAAPSSSSSGSDREAAAQDVVRVKRDKLESILRDGLSIAYDHTLTSAESTPLPTPSAATGSEPTQHARTGTKLTFANDAEVTAHTVIGCDGIHSALRKALFPAHAAPRVLPYAVFSGTRKLGLEMWREVYEPHFIASDGATSAAKISMCAVRALLQIWLDDFNPGTEEQDGEDAAVKVRWTYSRPSTLHSHDALYRPSRATNGAKDIPDEFFAELESLAPRLEPPFSAVFDVAAVRGDRVLHWLMRTSDIPLDELVARAGASGVFMLGDSVRGQPILGGRGGSEAVSDGLELAEFLAADHSENSGQFYQKRYQGWRQAVKTSEENIAKMYEHSN